MENCKMTLEEQNFIAMTLEFLKFYNEAGKEVIDKIIQTNEILQNKIESHINNYIENHCTEEFKTNLFNYFNSIDIQKKIDLFLLVYGKLDSSNLEKNDTTNPLFAKFLYLIEQEVTKLKNKSKFKFSKDESFVIDNIFEYFPEGSGQELSYLYDLSMEYKIYVHHLEKYLDISFENFKEKITPSATSRFYFKKSFREDLSYLQIIDPTTLYDGGSTNQETGRYEIKDETPYAFRVDFKDKNLNIETLKEVIIDEIEYIYFLHSDSSLENINLSRVNLKNRKDLFSTMLIGIVVWNYKKNPSSQNKSFTEILSESEFYKFQKCNTECSKCSKEERDKCGDKIRAAYDKVKKDIKKY